MKTDWDYTDLADAYLNRPPYSEDALNQLFDKACLQTGCRVCDIGAGVGHLTIPLASRSYEVVAVEPNNAMRNNGIKRTKDLGKISWVEATGTRTGLPDKSFDYVTFGSSFNVMDRQEALRETHRILKPGSWFTCMWNHRDLEDPVQKQIETIIHDAIPDYSYGERREDQAPVIMESGLFEQVHHVQGNVSHVQKVDDMIAAWRSHATLHRQAGDKFADIIRAISEYLLSLRKANMTIPYITRAWTARSIA